MNTVCTRMLLHTYFMKLPGAELLYTDLPWILLFLLILIVFSSSFYPPATDTENHPPLVDNVDNSSLPATDAKDTNNCPSLGDNVDNSSLPGRDATGTKNHPSPAATDSAAQAGTDRIDHDAVEVLHTGDHSFLHEINRVDHDPLPAMDEMDQGSVPTGDDGDHSEVVIVLVGNKSADKTGVVKSLTRSFAGNDCKIEPRKIAVDSTSKSCVQTVTCTSPERVIVNTTPLRNIKRRSPTISARRWVSRNCLRRILSGKDVVVVLVVTCKVQNTCKLDVLSNSNCWVDVFCQIFEDHKGAIIVLVNTEDQEDVPENIKSEIEHFVQKHGLSTKNITYSNLKEGDDSVKAIIEDGIHQRKISHDGSPHSTGVKSSNGGENVATDGRRQSRWKSCWQLKRGRSDANDIHRNETLRTVMPFRINVTPTGRKRFGPWGPERMILFGRTGSGKSTLAQMLTSGKLDKTNASFFISSGIRGGTREVQAGEGRGWYVVDTPGLGEPKDSKSTLSTSIVVELMRTYVRQAEGVFSQYMYVIMKDRLDALDERLWKFFRDLFGEEVKRRCTVLISKADDDWIQQNIFDLKSTFEGCESFVSADFPIVHEGDVEWEAVLKEVRTQSLSQLEENLASLNRYDMFCKYGQSAKMNMRMK